MTLQKYSMIISYNCSSGAKNVFSRREADAQATRVLLANAGRLPGDGAMPAVLSQHGDRVLPWLVLCLYCMFS